MAEIWEGKWVKDTDSEVFVFLGTCFNFGLLKVGYFICCFNFVSKTWVPKKKKKVTNNFYSTSKCDQNAPCFMENR